jgi:hypothetical protein
MTTLPRLTAVLAAVGASLFALPRAHACWDGHRAAVRRVTLSIPGDRRWTPEEARAAAVWGARIDALLPPGTVLDAFGGYAELCTDQHGGCGATMAEIRWDGVRLADLFAKVASATGASKAIVRRARMLGAQPLTVQVLAARSEANAKAFASRINAAGAAGIDGYFEAGGFPATNPSAHVLAAVDAKGNAVYRVVVGAFLTKADADAARAELYRSAGVDGFARAL